VDPHPTAPPVLHEDRLAEPQLRRDPLPLRRRDLRPVEEDPEAVAPVPVLVDEDAEDVEVGHAPILGAARG
jgi:hypothetical protein